MPITLSVLILIVIALISVAVDYYNDSRIPTRGKVKLADGTEHDNVEILSVNKQDFYLKGFLMENGAKLLLYIVAVFLIAPHLTDDTKIKMQSLLQKVDDLGKEVKGPEVTDDDLSKVTVSADRKTLKAPKLEKKDGEWIVVLTNGKAFQIDDGETITLTEVIQPEAQLMKRVNGKYSPGRQLKK